MAKGGLRAKHFKHPGGVLAVPRAMLRSPTYHQLSLVARCLLIELQDRWRPDKGTVNFSVRQAVQALGVGKTTAAAAFAEAAQLGFIKLQDESDWMRGMSRSWVLTWMSVNGKEPTDEWRSSGAEKLEPTSALRYTQPPKCPPSGTPKGNGEYKQNADKRENNELRDGEIEISSKSVRPEVHH